MSDVHVDVAASPEDAAVISTDAVAAAQAAASAEIASQAADATIATAMNVAAIAEQQAVVEVVEVKSDIQILQEDVARWHEAMATQSIQLTDLQSSFAAIQADLATLQSSLQNSAPSPEEVIAVPSDESVVVDHPAAQIEVGPKRRRRFL